MTFAQLFINTKARCGLINDPAYDIYLKLWLNDGQRNVVNRFLWPFLQQQETVTTVASTTLYNLSADCLVYDVRDTTNTFRLKFLKDLDFDAYFVQQLESGIPRFYRLFGQTQASTTTPPVPNLQLYPIPAGAYNLTVKSYKRLTDLVNDGDISQIPQTYHEMLINYASNIFFSSRGDVRATEQFDLYENKLSDMVVQLGGMPTDNIDVVRSLDQNEGDTFVRFPSNFGTMN